MTEYDDDRTRTHVALTQGTMVSHYRIESKIGAGGMGEVYLAEDTKLHRKVALKFMPLHLAENNELRQRFTREAQAVAKLEHQNIVTIHEVNEYQQRPYLVMQYVDGKTLSHYCYTEKLPLDKNLSLIKQIAEGISKAHGKGIIHRDIKSVNILVNKELQVKILDFGLATIQGTEELTKAGSTLGTFSYMSPEQATGKDVDHRSDIFSFGVVMYELLCGVSPFKASTDGETIQNILNKTPESAIIYNNDIPSSLDALIIRSLEKDPSKRFDSTDELLSELNKVAVKTESKEFVDDKPSIAVLPFANMSTDPENEFFADGLTEELLNVLAKIPELKVTGRTSSFAFKGKNEDLRTIGSKLGVGTILEGSVRKSGNRVRITAQLVKTSDGFHLWSDTYDRVIEDIFAVQDEIAASVADEMHVTLLGKTKEKPVDNIDSYQYYLKGMQGIIQWSKESTNEAIDYFNKAIELDKNNAKAYAGLARCYLVQRAYGLSDSPDPESDFKKIEDNLEKALALDSNLADAYEALSLYHFAFLFEYDKGVEYVEKAFSLAPNNSRVISSLGIAHGLLGDLEKASAYLKIGVELDPLNAESYMNLARIYLWQNNYDDAIVQIEKAIEISPNMVSSSGIKGLICLRQGKLEESLKHFQNEKGEGYRYCGLARVYHAMGNKEESDKALQVLLDFSDSKSWAIQIAMVYAFRNELDEAFKWLDVAVKNKDAGVPILNVTSYFDNIQSDPRWPELLKKAGF